MSRQSFWFGVTQTAKPYDFTSNSTTELTSSFPICLLIVLVFSFICICYHFGQFLLLFLLSKSPFASFLCVILLFLVYPAFHLTSCLLHPSSIPLMSSFFLYVPFCFLLPSWKSLLHLGSSYFSTYSVSFSFQKFPSASSIFLKRDFWFDSFFTCRLCFLPFLYFSFFLSGSLLFFKFLKVSSISSRCFLK